MGGHMLMGWVCYMHTATYEQHTFLIGLFSMPISFQWPLHPRKVRTPFESSNIFPSHIDIFQKQQGEYFQGWSPPNLV